jgi:nucleoside-diphosphate-sugar epimerase
MVVAVVAGANGYLGGHVVRTLNTKFEVIALARQPSPRQLQAKMPNIRWLPLTSFPDIRKSLPSETLLLFHCIGKSREAFPGDIFKGNIETTEYLVRSAEKQGFARIVYVSGYGVGTSSTSAYFTTKRGAEEIITSASLRSVIIRPSYILGGDDELVPRLIQEGRRTGSISYPGSGTYRLQPIFVEDFARLVSAILENDSFEDGTYDLLGDVISYKEFLEKIVERCHLPYMPKSRPIEDYVRDALFSERAHFSLDQLGVLLADRIGERTRELAGVRPRGLNEILDYIAESWPASANTG